MIQSFYLSLSCLNNKAIRSILLKTIFLTLLAIVITGLVLFWGGDYILSLVGWGMDLGSWSYLINLILSVMLGWFLFRIVAVLILWMFADDIVEAIEWEHYGHAAVMATKPSWIKSLLVGLRSLLRTIVYNILALPLYGIAAFTVIGAPIFFMIVNGFLLGRELEEMVVMRHLGRYQQHHRTPLHAHERDKWSLGRFERFTLGVAMNAAMMIPFVNFLVPVIATSMATHMMHRQ